MNSDRDIHGLEYERRISDFSRDRADERLMTNPQSEVGNRSKQLCPIDLRMPHQCV